MAAQRLMVTSLLWPRLRERYLSGSQVVQRCNVYEYRSPPKWYIAMPLRHQLKASTPVRRRLHAVSPFKQRSKWLFCVFTTRVTISVAYRKALAYRARIGKGRTYPDQLRASHTRPCGQYCQRYTPLDCHVSTSFASTNLVGPPHFSC